MKCKHENADRLMAGKTIDPYLHGEPLIVARCAAFKNIGPEHEP